MGGFHLGGVTLTVRHWITVESWRIQGLDRAEHGGLRTWYFEGHVGLAHRWTEVAGRTSTIIALLNL